MAQKSSYKEIVAKFTVSLKPNLSLDKDDHKEVSYQVGKKQKVKANQILAKIKIPAKKISFNISQELKVSEQKASRFLKKREGDFVSVGEILAQRGSKEVKSKNCASIASFNNGILELLTQDFEEEFVSPFSGEIESLDEEKIIILFPALELEGVWSVGSCRIGQLLFSASSQTGSSILNLNSQVEDKIIIFPEEISRGFWFKISSLGAKGIVGAKISGKEFQNYLMEFFSASEEDFLPTLLLKKDDNFWQSMRKFQGHQSLIDGFKNRLLINL